MNKPIDVPNQRCVAKGCRKIRTYFVFTDGAAMNLCTKHLGQLEDSGDLEIKDINTTYFRIVEI